jgi:predicted DNA-binding WGR domain protein
MEVIMMIRYQNPAQRRYYTAHLTQDLFGDWVLVRAWGSLDSRHGSMQTEWMASQSAGLAALDSLDKRRRARHYQPLSA